MLSRCKLLGSLTTYQLSLLLCLQSLYTQAPHRFWRPKDLGASRSSHHSQTLASLSKLDLVEKMQLSTAQKAPFGYRITQKGLKELQTLQLISDVSTQAILGSGLERIKDRLAYEMLAEA